MVRINILLPDFSKDPVGGLKVQYEFANRLAARGHDVAIYHSLNFDRGVWQNPRAVPGLLRWNLLGTRTLSWFPLRRDVHCYFLPQIIPSLLRRADATIFNAFMIADRLPAGSERTGPLYEIVYEYPVWRCGRPELRQHLRRSLQRPDVAHIATGKAVEQMLAEFNVTPVTKITCGIDLPDPANIPSAGERKPIVAFPLRPEAHKGGEDILRAVPLIRARHPEAVIESFGRYHEGATLPEGLLMHGYLDDDALLALYRRSAVFVLPSHAEGWGLPAAEAMANGAAVVVTDNGGSSDFAIDGETALVVPTGDPEALANATCRLLDDIVLRERLVTAAMQRCAEMSWDPAVEQLDALLAAGVARDR